MLGLRHRTVGQHRAALGTGDSLLAKTSPSATTEHSLLGINFPLVTTEHNLLGINFHSTQQTRAKQTSKESKTVDEGKDATRTMLDQTLEVKTMEGEMGGPRMALLVVLPRTAETASATKTTMGDFQLRRKQQKW